jgi:hypothetical protein
MLITRKIAGLINKINMESFQSGVYILKVFAGDEIKTLKVTKR